MLFQVAHVSILGRLFLLVYIMDEEIETIRSRIRPNSRLKLLLVKHDQLLDSLAEQIEQPPPFSASVSWGSLLPL